MEIIIKFTFWAQVLNILDLRNLTNYYLFKPYFELQLLFKQNFICLSQFPYIKSQINLNNIVIGIPWNM
jgi:hypothetical protein